MKVIQTASIVLACAALLASCSNAPDNQVTAATVAKSILNGRKAAPAPSARQIAADVTNALAATDAPLILLSIPERRAATVMQKLEHNNGFDTYGTGDRRSVTLRGGIVTGTRGLGNDIMSSDIDAVRALITARKEGTAQRVMRYLDGEDLTIAKMLTCRVSVTASNKTSAQLTEACLGDGSDFTNTYKVTPSGKITQSRQWHSEAVQYLTIQTLR